MYRARDTKLKRDVALKVLPEIFAGDPSASRDSQREAQLLASLNHPDIVTIYSVEEATRIAAIAAVALFAIALIVGRLWLTRSSTGGAIDSLAVLPFVNVGADPNAEYLSRRAFGVALRRLRHDVTRIHRSRSLVGSRGRLTVRVNALSC